MLVTIPPNLLTTVHKKAEAYEVMMSKKLLVRNCREMSSKECQSTEQDMMRFVWSIPLSCHISFLNSKKVGCIAA